MEEFQDTDSIDDDGPEESAVLKELRNQLRASQKQNETLKAFQAEMEVAAQTQRSEVAKEIVITLGLPGLTEDVLQWVAGDITQESVIEALQARSIPLPEGTEQQKPQDTQTPSASDVGQQLADAVAGADGRSLEERIAATEDAAELASLMEEAELTRSHS